MVLYFLNWIIVFDWVNSDLLDIKSVSAGSISSATLGSTAGFVADSVSKKDNYIL